MPKIPAKDFSCLESQLSKFFRDSYDSSEIFVEGMDHLRGWLHGFLGSPRLVPLGARDPPPNAVCFGAALQACRHPGELTGVPLGIRKNMAPLEIGKWAVG